MAFFGKSDTAKTEESKSPYEREQRNNLRITIRMLVIVYLLYIVYKLIKGYVSGDADVTLGVIILACVLFVVCCVYFAFMFLKDYRKEQARIAELREEIRREREAEEAAAQAAEAAVDDDPDDEEDEDPFPENVAEHGDN